MYLHKILITHNNGYSPSISNNIRGGKYLKLFFSRTPTLLLFLSHFLVKLKERGYDLFLQLSKGNEIEEHTIVHLPLTVYFCNKILRFVLELLMEV